MGGIIVKTIKERAKEYSKGRWDEPTAYEAYIAGAKEQKAIDDAEWLKIKSSWEREAQINHNDENNYKQGFHDAIEKACEWLKENIEGGVHPQSAYGFADRFRKAMEEQI